MYLFVSDTNPHDELEALRRAVAENVRIALHRKRISQAKAAAAVGISQSSMSRRIVGDLDFSISELYAVARLLEMPVPALLPRPVAPVA